MYIEQSLRKLNPNIHNDSIDSLFHSLWQWEHENNIHNLLLTNEIKSNKHKVDLFGNR